MRQLMFFLPGIAFAALDGALQLSGFTSATVATALAALSAVSFIIPACYFGHEWWQSRRAPMSAQAKTQWQSEWNERQQDRRAFWKEANTAYRNWKENPEAGRALQDLIRAASIPADLPLNEGTALWNWISGPPPPKLSPIQARLFNFAEFVYTTASWQLDELEGFDDLRMRLAKFWDEWGRKTPVDSAIRDQNAAGIVKSSAPELAFLTYLEMARARVRSTGATGKTGLFRLARVAEGMR